MKIILRRLAFALLLAAPAVAFASELTSSASPACCGDPGCCPKCEHCPFR